MDAAGVADDPGQLDDLRRVAPGGRVVVQAARQPDGALVDPLAEQPGRVGQRVAGQGCVVEPERLEPERAVRHEVGHVDRDPLVERGSEGRDAGRVEVVRWIAEQAREVVAVHAVVRGRQRCVRHAVQRNDFRRDPLPQPVVVLRIREEHALGMGVRVDEPRRHGQARGVDHALGGGVAEVADGADDSGLDRDVGVPGRPAGPVDDGPVPDEDVERHDRNSSGAGSELGPGSSRSVAPELVSGVQTRLPIG